MWAFRADQNGSVATPSASGGDPSTSTNPRTINFALWNSSMGAVFPATKADLLLPYVASCAANDQCFTQSPQDDGPIIAGGRH